MLLTPTVGVSAGEGEEEEERDEPVDKVRCVSCVLHKLPTTKKSGEDDCASTSQLTTTYLLCPHNERC